MRKPAFCICENKDADQLRGNRKADQRLCFRYTDSRIFFLNPKFQASSHLLWLYSPVCVAPGQKPRKPLFSQRGSFKYPSRFGEGFSQGFNLKMSLQGLSNPSFAKKIFITSLFLSPLVAHDWCIKLTLLSKFGETGKCNLFSRLCFFSSTYFLFRFIQNKQCRAVDTDTLGTCN